MFPRRFRVRIARSGMLFTLALVLIALAAIVSANNLLFLILAAMLSALFVSGIVSRLVLSGLELHLILPDHIAARRPTTARLRLRNLKRFIPSFSLRLTGEGVALYFPILAGNRTLEEPVHLTFPRRGTNASNLFIFSTRFPFGFLENTAHVTLRRPTVIYPALDPQPGFEDLLRGILGEIDAHQRGPGTDFYRIRPYQLSESARHVDWKTTARTGELQLREFALDRQPAVEIHLDSHTPDENSFELAVECAAYLCWELSRLQHPVALHAEGFSARCPEDADVYTMLRFLALVQRSENGRSEPPQDHARFQILLPAHLNTASTAATGAGARA